jgi:hypothetical protein
MGILRTDKISGLETPTAVTGSVYFDGVSNDSLQIANNTDFDFPGDFTIECWVYSITALGDYNQDYAHIAGKGNGISASTYSLAFYQSKINFNTSDSGGTYTVRQGATTLTNNTWYHFAVTRQSNTLRLFVNGVQDYSATVSDDLTNTKSFNIGDRESGDPSANYPLNGYISNLRILKGTALYTSDFTVPIHELEVIGDTVLLCCNNPDSAGADGTGKTITVNGDAAVSTVSPGLTRDFTGGTEFEGVTTFDTQGYFVPPSGTTEQRFPTNFGVGSGRGVFMGGLYPGNTVNTIDYVTIPTLGNAQDFGNLSEVKRLGGAFSSSTRAVAAGGFLDPANTNTIEYVTIASTGDSKDFGDLTSNLKRANGGLANSTRGISFGGTPDTTAEFTTIASMGNAVRFGSLLTGGAQKYGSASSTRGLMAGGETPSLVKSIDMITIASTGDAIDFGDLTDNTSGHCAVSSPTRIVFVGGEQPSPVGIVNVMEFVTTAALGNATNFGDLSSKRRQSGTASSSTRGIIAGGGNDTPASNTAYNIIDYITISTTGDSQDFGDLSQARWQIFNGTVSDSHGGLS